MAVVTASPKTMGRLVELQEASLGELATIRETLVSGGAIEVVAQHTEAMENLTKSNDNLVKQSERDYAAIQEVSENFKIIKTPLEKMGDRFDSLKDTLSDPKRMALDMLPNFLGGFKERAIQKNDFIKSQKALGSEKSDAELAADFKESRKAAKEMQKASAELAKLSKLTGLSESQLAGTKQGGALISARKEAGDRLASTDLRASFAGGDAPAAPSPTNSPVVAAAEAAVESPAAKEQHSEDMKAMDYQTEILEQIRDSLLGKGTNNTSGGGGEDGGGNGLLSSFGSKADAMNKGFGGNRSSGLVKGAAALILISGAVWIAADAMTKFGDVEWEDVGKGVVTLGSLVIAAKLLSKAAPEMILGAVGVGLLSGALWIAGESMSNFAELDWETIGKGLVAMGGIGLIGAAAGAAAPLLVAGAAGLAALGGSAWIIGEAMQAIGEGIKEMVDGLERLSNLDGNRLTSVADGMYSISGALVAFGAAGAAGGLTTLIGNLLTIGQDSPIEQLQKLSEMSTGLVRAGRGITSIATAMTGFAGMDPKEIEVLDEVPWDDMEDFADAKGVMIMEKAGAKITAGSGEAMANAGAFTVTPAAQSPLVSPVGRTPAEIAAANVPSLGAQTERASVVTAMARSANASGGGGSVTNVVNAPVSNSNTSAITYRPPIRNTNPSGNRFAGRFGR